VETSSEPAVFSSPPHILVVDDEAGIRGLLQRYLSTQGFRVSTAAECGAARALLERELIDLILLDLGLPGEDGLSLTRYLRERWRGAVIIVSGRGDPVERVIGLEVGADDYVSKPFDLRELLARVRSVLRRTRSATAPPANEPGKTLEFEGFSLDVRARQLHDATGVEIALTSGEFELLLALLESPNRVQSRERLMQRMHGREPGPFDRAIDVQISRLRQKIERDPARPVLIKTVRNAGYVLTSVVARH
jgi:two-component system OmpR family response regulator